MCIPTLPDVTSHRETSSLFTDKNKNQQKNKGSVITGNSSTSGALPRFPVVAQHNYHDHATEQNLVDSSSNDDSKFFHWRIKPIFPLKLYEMLDRVEDNGHADIISWQPHGRCFVIHNPKALSKILPMYFSFSKMPSFRRQLNLYGFSRLTRGRDKGGYYHELFLRGKQFLINKIQRIEVKGTGVRPRSNPNAEPDFWNMDWVGRSATTLQCNPNGKSSKENVKIEGPPPPSFQAMRQDEPLVGSFEGKQFYFVNADLKPENDEVESITPELPLSDLLGDAHSVVGEDTDFALSILQACILL